MKWFLAINEEAKRASGSTGFLDYARLLQVAISSGQRYQGLEPHVLYDGKPNWLTEWLDERGVPIWWVRSMFYDQLQAIAQRRGDPWVTQVGAGALLRVELPRLALERGVQDRYVLYTDVDVLFVADPTEALRATEPRYFAAAPEEKPDDVAPMNSGVMVMNLPRLRREQRRFLRHLRKNLHRYSVRDRPWDQDAYQNWYGLHRQRLSHKLSWRLERVIGVRLARSVLWDPLPPTLNWKPHWGANPNAQIIHFLGAKPHHRREFHSPDFLRRPGMAYLRRTDMAYFSALCETWDEELRLIERAARPSAGRISKGS